MINVQCSIKRKFLKGFNKVVKSHYGDLTTFIWEWKDNTVMPF